MALPNMNDPLVLAAAARTAAENRAIVQSAYNSIHGGNGPVIMNRSQAVTVFASALQVAPGHISRMVTTFLGRALREWPDNDFVVPNRPVVEGVLLEAATPPGDPSPGTVVSYVPIAE